MAVIPVQGARRRGARLTALLSGFWEMLDRFVGDRLRRTAAEAAQVRPRPHQRASSQSKSVQ
jgi:hypothetical protein